ncbi:MAG: flagellar hook-associated protein FlgK [Burkholderiales bacterium]
MASGIFGIATSGLTAAQAGLATAGHNIANANTPGYHRQVVEQSNATPQLTGGGFIGRGVEVDSVRRIYNSFIDGQAARSEAQASYYSTYQAQVGQIDSLLSDPDAGLAPELERFFAAVNEVAGNAASVPSRQAMLAAGSSLIARFQALDSRLIQINQGLNVEIQSTVSSVNAYAKQIAGLNGRIAEAQSNPNQPPNDLIDERDRLVGQLNALVGANAIEHANGTVSLSIGSGQNLVVGNEVFQLTVMASPEVPEQLDVGYRVGGGTVRLTHTALTGGSLGALLAFRANTLSDTRNQLGRIAAGLELEFNAQHRLGQDLRGAAGGDFFSQPQATVTARTDNGGSGELAATLVDASALVASDYRVTYSAGNYRVTRLTDGNTTLFAGLPQTVDGMTIQLSAGVPADGDSFLIEPARYVARNMSLAFRDTALIAAAAPMRTASVLANTGNASIDAGVVQSPLDANVQQPVSIVFTSPSTFNVVGVGTGNPVGVAYTSGADISYNGWTVRISGAPASGDTFRVEPNTSGIADNRNATALAALQSAATLEGSTISFQGAYGQFASFIGNTAREMDIAAQAQEAIAGRAREAQQSLSGVNLDEEAANLLRYQQAYQAAAKTIQVAATLFDSILALGN